VQRIDVTLAPGTASKAGITVLGNGNTSTVIGYDGAAGELYVDRSNSGNTAFHPLFASVDSAPVTVDANGNVTLRIYVDRSSVEVFAQNGLRTITDQVFPEQGANQVALFAEGGTAQLKSITVMPLASSMFGTAEKPTNNRG
jgi:levanase